MAALVERLLAEIETIPLLDPHSHINPQAPLARDLNDLLGYHYYTELAHSAGLDKRVIEQSQGFEKSRRLVEQLADCSNTTQWGWLLQLAQSLFDFPADELTLDNVANLYQAIENQARQPGWEDEIFRRTNLEGIFLTNEFDDPLTGFDAQRYLPCLRTDDLVFKLGAPQVRERFARTTGIELQTWRDLDAGLGNIFDRFVRRGARACAISLPPDFAPQRLEQAAADAALVHLLQGRTDELDYRLVAHGVFYRLADKCDEFHLPFDLMIGVNRQVYSGGVYQGQDLFDQRTSLIQYRQLFNDKPRVRFPISVLTHPQNQELVSYAWIFPNVIAQGHWWYSNVPAFIEPDLRARLEAVPRSKVIGYYSDAYKLEFVLPKFSMFRRVLAGVLAEHFVIGRRWSETRAIDLARTILRTNVDRIFPAAS